MATAWGDESVRKSNVPESMYLMGACVCDLDEEPNVFHPEVTNCYRQNDPDTGRSRYIVQAQLWVCE